MLIPRVRVLIFLFAALINLQHGNSFLSSTLSPNAKRLITRTVLFSNKEIDATSSVVDPSTAPPVIPPNILGPPESLRNLNIGEQLNAFRKVGDKNNMNKANFTIERVGYTPDIFCLRNFLSPSECKEIQDMVPSDMRQAETITENDVSSRKNCTVAWIPPTGSNLVNNLVSSTANLFLSKSVLSNPSAGVEDLQVLKYGIGGEFVLHHDGEPRILTVIYYINGVGGTWFPLARTSNNVGDDPCLDMDAVKMGETFNRSRKEPQNKAQAMDLGQDLRPGEDGLLVKGTGCIQKEEKQTQNEHTAWINQGDAVIFYNYCDDGSARLNWRSLHCGLPTSEEDGTKWIANHWFRVGDLIDIEG